ncbi:MAG: flagellar biosynthesis anti-sigma factor FlgM [Halieaceae bacterium]|jgi:negative regulator of flagellin synthesis FlgM|nr:flagellar biosynthesis anti-sigma factor FlgM [Halieaceae bacterium]
MNTVDNNVGMRTQRTEVDTATSRSSELRRPAGSPASNPPDAAPVRDEAVSITQTASDLLGLEAELRALPNIDQERVDAIRQSIEDGSFEIDVNDIANRLIESDRELSA